eukprot:1183272-Prymnesium_polylepis.1
MPQSQFVERQKVAIGIVVVPRRAIWASASAVPCRPARPSRVPRLSTHTAWEARGNPSENTTLKVRCR